MRSSIQNEQRQDEGHCSRLATWRAKRFLTMENLILPLMAVSVIHIYIYVPYIHIPENTWKSLWTQLKRDKVVLEIKKNKTLGMDMLDSEIVLGRKWLQI